MRAAGSLIVAATLLGAPPGTAPAASPCPEADTVLQRLARLDPARATRTARFDTPPPVDLYRKAANKPGTTLSTREGQKGFGVVLAEMPIESLWAALNDEPHHALDGGYFPVRHSEVIGGTPRGPTRLLFQYFKKLGVGRWWVSRVQMNRELFEESGGALWELHWEGRMDEVDPTAPPMNMVSADMSAVLETRGAWLMLPLADRCTLVEYFTWSDPGGFVGATQWLLAGRVLRSTLQGLMRMAEEHVALPHPDARFVRPDGTPLFGEAGP